MLKMDMFSAYLGVAPWMLNDDLESLIYLVEKGYYTLYLSAIFQHAWGHFRFKQKLSMITGKCRHLEEFNKFGTFKGRGTLI